MGRGEAEEGLTPLAGLADTNAAGLDIGVQEPSPMRLALVAAAVLFVAAAPAWAYMDLQNGKPASRPYIRTIYF